MREKLADSLQTEERRWGGFGPEEDRTLKNNDL